MRNATPATLLAALSATVLIGGCVGTAPTLTVTEAFIAERSPSDGSTVVRVIVKAENHASEPVAMWAIAYTGAGAPGGVERWAQATAPAGGTVSFELPVVAGANQSGSSPLAVSGRVAYVPGGRFRELLSELSVPLPSTTFSGSVDVDWSAPVRPPATLRVGTARTAIVLDHGPARAVDTLPPLKTPN